MLQTCRESHMKSKHKSTYYIDCTLNILKLGHHDLFTCVRADLYVGLASTDNECTFWSAVQTVWTNVRRMITCDKCDHMWQVWPDVTSVTRCDKCDHMWQAWPHMTIVEKGDHISLVWPYVTSGKCDHLGQVWPNVTSVPKCDTCAHMWHVWPQFGHMVIVDKWTSWIFGYHGYLDIMDIWISWIFGFHGYLDFMDIWILYGKSNLWLIINIWTSWTYKIKTLEILFNQHLKHCWTQVSEDISF